MTAATRQRPEPRESATRCAMQAQLRGDPLIGTAFPAARVLLVEQPGPWGRDGLVDSRFPTGPARELIRRAARAGVRVQAVRRPGRTPPSGPRRWGLADTRPEVPVVRWGRFGTPEQLLDLPLDGSAGALDPRPLFLVCAHGRHDACCALRGRNLAAALAAERPGRVWETTHLSGDRFAANVLVLPSGLLYGRVLPVAAAGFAAAAEADEVVGGLLRGRIGHPPAVQAALAYAYEHLAVRRRAEVRPLGPPVDADGVTRVPLHVRGAAVEVDVRSERRAAAGLTCAAPGPGHFVTYRAVALRPCP